MTGASEAKVDKPLTKPYQCSLCENRYTRQEHLDRHVTAKHAQSRDFACETCGKTFSRKDILKRHEKTHAAKDLNGKEPPRKQPRGARTCDTCLAAKVKCSGDSPCARCHKLERDCVYASLGTVLPDFLTGDLHVNGQQYANTAGLPFGANQLLNSPLSAGLMPELPSNDTQGPQVDYNIDPLLFLGQQSHIESSMAQLNTRLFSNAPHSEQQLNDLFNPTRPAPASFLPPSFDMLNFAKDPIWDGMGEHDQTRALLEQSAKTGRLSRRHTTGDEFDFNNYGPGWSPNTGSLQLPITDDRQSDLDGMAAGSSDSPMASADGSVGQEAYSRCIRNLRSIHSVSPFSKAYLPPVDTRDTFNRLINCYFNNGSSIFPFIHRATFDPNSCHWVLVLALVAQGAKYGQDDLASTAHANSLCELVIRALTYLGEQDTENLKQTWYHQATLMVVSTGLTTSEQYHYDWAQVNKHLAVTYCQRLRWLDDIHFDRQAEIALPLRERWLRWVKREGIKRLGLCIFSNEALSSLLWGTYQTELWNEVAVAYLPCSDDLWRAENETEWAALFVPEPLPPTDSRVDAIFRAACYPEKHEAALAGCRSWLGVFVLNWFSHTLIIKSKATNSTMRFLLEDDSTGELFPAFSTAFNVDHLVKLRNVYHLLENICTPREDREREAATLARLLHLDGLTDGLPAVFLQSYARRCAQAGALVCPTAVTEWLSTQNGALARRTCYHAGQLFALKGKPLSIKSRESDVFDAYSLFYAAIVLMFFTRFAPTIKPAGQPDVNLAQRRSHKDPTLTLWVTEGNGIACLPTIGQLNLEGSQEESSLRILSAVAGKLGELRHVQIAGQLSQVLSHLLKIGRTQQTQQRDITTSSLFRDI